MSERTIERGRSYQLTDFRKIAGLGRDAMRMDVGNSLRVRKVGIRKYATGDGWFEFLASRPHAAPQAAEARP